VFLRQLCQVRVLPRHVSRVPQALLLSLHVHFRIRYVLRRLRRINRGGRRACALARGDVTGRRHVRDGGHPRLNPLAKKPGLETSEGSHDGDRPDFEADPRGRVEYPTDTDPPSGTPR
jgi:hypothetical protein